VEGYGRGRKPGIEVQRTQVPQDRGKPSTQNGGFATRLAVWLASLLACVSFCLLLVLAQVPRRGYRLVLHNEYVQVFDLRLRPEEQAPLHDNIYDLFWIALDNGILQWDSREGSSKELRLEAGDARLFLSHEINSLRNKTAGPVHSVVVELRRQRFATGSCPCSSDVARAVCGCAPAPRLPSLWALAIQGTTFAETTLESGQSLNELHHRDNTLLVAIRLTQLQHEVNVRNSWQAVHPGSARIELAPGDVEWLPEGKHRLTNVGDKEARFITIEF
jgi:hypothetical protein